MIAAPLLAAHVKLREAMHYVGNIKARPDDVQRVRLAFDHLLIAEALLKALNQ